MKEKPANPTPAERAERQQIAAAIIESMRHDEKMSLPGLKAIAVQYKGVFFDAVEVEEFVFKFAQEITILLKELSAMIAELQARRAIDPTPNELGALVDVRDRLDRIVTSDLLNDPNAQVAKTYVDRVLAIFYEQLLIGVDRVRNKAGS
jgi:hypothetical protein